MSRPSRFVLTGVFLLIIAVLGGLPYFKGGLYLDSHEADVYHLLDITFRMKDGSLPHLDFVTPLGILAFFPIVSFLQAGLSFGAAFIASQIAVALFLVPIAVYALSTRLTQLQAVLFGCVAFFLVLNLTYLKASSGVTVAMHYNRWCWAISFFALALAFFPLREGVVARPKLEGVLLGLLATVLIMMKVTFFVALAPAILAALLVRKQAVSIAYAAITAVALIAISTVFLGVAFWSAYIADLLNVTRSEVRPNVGVPFAELVSGAPYIGATLAAIATGMLIRRAGFGAMGLVVIGLLFPGFVYVSYQNFANDPTWLVFMAFLVLVYRPEVGYGSVNGVDLRGMMNVVAVVAVLVNFPSFYTTALTPIEHLAFDKDRFMPLLDDPADSDLYLRRGRGSLMTAAVALDDRPGVWEKYRDAAERRDIPVVAGVSFPMCELGAGSHAHLNEIAAQLSADGIAPGSQFFTTGLLTAFWLYGDFEPLQNGAPWYYGDLTGLENADYVLIPKCVFVERARHLMIADLLNAKTPLTLLHDNEVYTLFELR